MRIVTHRYFWVGVVAGVAGYYAWGAFLRPRLAQG